MGRRTTVRLIPVMERVLLKAGVVRLLESSSCWTDQDHLHN